MSLKKSECIAKFGEEAWKRQLKKAREWKRKNRDKVKASINERRKGGKHYEEWLKYNRTGVPKERKRIRNKHRLQYQSLIEKIGIESEIHHEWIDDTAEYRGVALVEKEAHKHRVIRVIQILEGEITIFGEEYHDEVAKKDYKGVSLKVEVAEKLRSKAKESGKTLSSFLEEVLQSYGTGKKEVLQKGSTLEEIRQIVHDEVREAIEEVMRGIRKSTSQSMVKEHMIRC